MKQCIVITQYGLPVCSKIACGIRLCCCHASTGCDRSHWRARVRVGRQHYLQYCHPQPKTQHRSVRTVCDLDPHRVGCLPQIPEVTMRLGFNVAR